MKKIIGLILAVLMLMSVLPVSAFAVNYDATPSVRNFKQLEAAIDDIDDGDTVLITLLRDITIFDELEIDEECTIYFQGGHNFILGDERAFYIDEDYVYLYFDRVGFYHPDNHEAIFDGHAIYVDGEDCIINGARFEGVGSRDRDWDGFSAWSGGAIYVNDLGCRISDCQFLNCGCQSDGGAIYVCGADCIIQDCDFANCKAASEGGAIFVNKTGCEIRRCSFLECEGSGGAIYDYGAETKISNCEFTSCSNHAICMNWDNCTIENCKFVDCHATRDGGALSIEEDECLVKNCTFSNCYSERKYSYILYRGGAAYVEDDCDDVYFEKCTFKDCYCPDDGQYVYSDRDAETTIINCTPNTKDRALYYDCSFSTSSSIPRGLFGSTFSNGSVWVVAGIGAVAVVAVSVIMAKKKKKAAVTVAAETEETAETEEE